MNGILDRAIACLCLGLGAVEAAGGERPPIIRAIPGQADLGTIEIHGVGAGRFESRLWQTGPPHMLPDVRSPLIAPRRAGVFRNIYAPSVVPTPEGWRVFYGAWDGVDSGNDRIYSVRTRDFVDFDERRIEIEHGSFIHVCNVSALRIEEGPATHVPLFAMLCTVWPDARNRNKPAFFSSPDGTSWNGRPVPYAAGPGDIVAMEGYAPYDDADVNGVNVLFREGGRYVMYFGNWSSPGQIHRASSADGRRYRYEGPCLDSSHAVNDVKKLSGADGPWYLMALHANGDRLWYALSRDGRRFDGERELARNLGPEDRYIVAVGWVVREDRLLGLLYGAGAVPSLDRNRIFGRWVQKKVVLTDANGRRYEPIGALGPDRQIIGLGQAEEIECRAEVFAEDGRTLLAGPTPLKVGSGRVYVVHPDAGPPRCQEQKEAR